MIYLTIDFEDFAHDIKRDLGVWETGPIKEKELYLAVEKIESLKESLGINGVTFFCTGLIAHKLPRLIKYIASCNNEIACHYYYHDSVQKDKNHIVHENLKKAKHYLSEASETEVCGFRAPKFDVDVTDLEFWDLINQEFKYDSSLDALVLLLNTKLSTTFDLKFIPITNTTILSKNIRIGGTYLKFMSYDKVKSAIDKSLDNNYPTQIYIHPYEVLVMGEFKLNYSELSGLPLAKKLYWIIRQNQWHGINKHSILDKLIRLGSDYKFNNVLVDELV